MVYPYISSREEVMPTIKTKAGFCIPMQRGGINRYLTQKKEVFS
jgi:hypothetical protein